MYFTCNGSFHYVYFRWFCILFGSQLVYFTILFYVIIHFAIVIMLYFAGILLRNIIFQCILHIIAFTLCVFYIENSKPNAEYSEFLFGYIFYTRLKLTFCIYPVCRTLFKNKYTSIPLYLYV